MAIAAWLRTGRSVGLCSMWYPLHLREAEGEVVRARRSRSRVGVNRLQAATLVANVPGRQPDTNPAGARPAHAYLKSVLTWARRTAAPSQDTVALRAGRRSGASSRPSQCRLDKQGRHHYAERHSLVRPQQPPRKTCLPKALLPLGIVTCIHGSCPLDAA